MSWLVDRPQHADSSGGARPPDVKGAALTAIIWSKRLIGGVMALGLAGCTVGPDFHAPAPPTVIGFLPQPLANHGSESPDRTGVAQRFIPGASVDRRWWSVFGSAKLDALEDEALKRNNDVAAAEAVLRQARELYLAQRGTLLPNVQLAANASRVRNAAVLASPLSSNAEIYSLYDAQFNVGYVLDVFGGQRRQLETLAAQTENQQFALEAVYLTLSANVANTAIQIASLNDQRAAVRQNVAANRRLLEFTRQMQARGESSTTDVAAAEAALAQAEQAAPPLEKQIGQLQDLMAVYLGHPMADSPPAGFTLSDFRLPKELPISLPVDLVRQRPDIRAAEANLHAASAQVGVAIAARLPSITLTGALGGTSNALGTLFSGDNVLWSVGAGVGQTLFDGGSARHRQRAAEAGLDQAKAQYRGVVLAALQNTADVLQSIDKDADALILADRAATAAERSASLSRSLFAHGQIGVIASLNADAAAAQAQSALIQARAARFTDTIGLYQALGGGWTDAGSGAFAPEAFGRRQ